MKKEKINVVLDDVGYVSCIYIGEKESNSIEIEYDIDMMPITVVPNKTKLIKNDKDEWKFVTNNNDIDIYNIQKKKDLLRSKRLAMLQAFDLWEKAVVRRQRRRFRRNYAMVSRYS